MGGISMNEASGVHETAKSLAESLRQYIEAQYHIRDEGLVRERHALLLRPETIVQTPYVEATAVYKVGDPFAQLAIPKIASDTLTQLSHMGLGLYPRPYEHQSQALTAFLGAETADLVVATGTGSGKTESFLMPIIGQLAIEGQDRPQSAQLPGCRALLLYPMNALVNDQLARIRRLIGNTEASSILTQNRSQPIRFGSYTGRTPYPGERSKKRDERFIEPLFEEFYNKVAVKPAVKDELVRIGRWPSKDLEGFYGATAIETKTYSSGKKKGENFTKKHWDGRLQTQSTDREMMTRHEMQARCPELLITNYSMLEYMLMRPIERDIFDQTKAWLKADPRNEFILVLDEAHMYRGAGGAEVALLIRRLCARLDIPRERMRCIMTSASLGPAETAAVDGERFARDLTGLADTSPRRVRVIQGTPEQRCVAQAAPVAQLEALADFNLADFQRSAEDLHAATEAAAQFAHRLGWSQPPHGDHAAFRNWLFEHLTGFEPLENLITAVSGRAVRLDDLSHQLFGEHPSVDAEKATDALLALGSYAQRSTDGRVLLPTRLHLFHRGLPGLFACVNPACSQRLGHHDGPTILGRLHTKPSTQCGCEANGRVYELLTHRDCGAAFLRGFVNEDQDFVWHQPSGPLSDGAVATLMPIELCVEDATHPRSRHIEKWLHMASGKLLTEQPSDETGFRRVRVPDKAAEAGNLTFDHCPVCTRKIKTAKDAPSKIMDHLTKGEAPFTALVRTQMAKQPASRAKDKRHPNAGRKVLIFSDGRQKAARLARDIPRDIELDVFRQAVALACHKLKGLGKAAKPTGLLYLAFLSVLTDHDLPIFDGGDSRRVENARKLFDDNYDSDLAEAIGESFTPQELPARYQIALLKLLCGNYYSLTGTMVGFVEPTAQKLRKLIQHLSTAGVVISDGNLRELAVGWIDSMLQEYAFDKSIEPVYRWKAAGYANSAWGSNGQFGKPLKESLAAHFGWSSETVQRVEAIFRDQLAEECEGAWFLVPDSLAVVVDLAHCWAQCADCTALMPFALAGKVCLACGSDAASSLDPKNSDYVTARKNFWRLPVARALAPGAELSNMSVEEHTAQLSNRDRSRVHATTELYEMRFQDVLIEDRDRPIDVLSCTTTMEVGVDIGSLVAVALRNVPPQRENYQQRAGRAGRRGSSVSTVVTYSQNGPHDSHYFLNPERIVAGPPRTPEVKIDNAKIARRHIHAYLIQTFFHEFMAQCTDAATDKNASLLKALGPTEDFFCGSEQTGPTLKSFEAWVARRVLVPDGDLRESIVAWLPPGLDTRGLSLMEWLANTSKALLVELKELGTTIEATMTQEVLAEQDNEDGENLPASVEQAELLEFLFFHGLLPSYAFPTSLCSFLVEKFSKNTRDGWEVRTVQRPQQSITKALSEYAPGRLIVIDKKTYRSGGVFADLPAGVVNRAGPLFENKKPHTHCKACSFVRDPNRSAKEPMTCPVCGQQLVTEQMIVPQVFGPEGADDLPENDREQEITYATMAQLPQPVDPEVFSFSACGPYASFTHAIDRTLVTVNRGKEGTGEGGFSVCMECGHASVFDQEANSGPHDRPYKPLGPKGTPKKCSGQFARVLLGHHFDTDLLLLRLKVAEPIVTDTVNGVVLHILEDALHSLAEALRLAASRHRQLDLDPAEFGSGFRIEPALQDGARILDVFLYDMLSGGAGYAEIVARHMDEVLDATLELLENCSCESSCTECLNHFHNQHLQHRLDRQLGAMLLRYAVRGEVPACSSATNQLVKLAQLRASLELAGYSCRVGQTASAPLLVERQGRTVAVSCYPGLIDSAERQQPTAGIAGAHAVIGLNDYLLRSDLVTAQLKIQGLFKA
ncbi:DEAD/DEAH box helicase [Pseudomonas fakonensis]|uniref:DEAD/DEAH box helicase n=2 Tax=Pseudomonas fakonensis TaxID=2842355 RepID=A0ABX8MXK6_9PSED|nr:DEAD/DEAH box helicase [Pseudomonas fakonensis]